MRSGVVFASPAAGEQRILVPEVVARYFRFDQVRQVWAPP
jgi:hypothetical protein